MCGVVPETVDATKVTPLEIVNFTCFNPPVLLRTSEKVLFSLTLSIVFSLSPSLSNSNSNSYIPLIPTSFLKTKAEYLRTQTMQVTPILMLRGTPEIQYFGHSINTVTSPHTLPPSSQPVIIQPMVQPAVTTPLVNPLMIPPTPTTPPSNPFTPAVAPVSSSTPTPSSSRSSIPNGGLFYVCPLTFCFVFLSSPIDLMLETVSFERSF